MKKLLYVHTSVETIGGRETFLESILSSHYRFEAHIILTNEGKLSKMIRNLGFKNILILNNGRMRFIHRTIKVIWKIFLYIKRNKIDFVVALGSHDWIYAVCAARMAKIVSIFYYRGIIDKSSIGFFNPAGFIAAHLKPDIVIANSIATKESLVNHFKYSVVSVIYPGIEIEKFRINSYPMKLRNELGIPDGSNVVSIIGRIQEGKGQEYFIKAANFVNRELPNTIFLVVGECTFRKDLAYFEKVKTLIKQFSIGNKVIFTGFRHDIPEIIALSDILVYPSIFPEGFGRGIVEGMAAGKPVIVTNIGGPLEIITDGVNGIFVPPENERSLSMEIVELLKDGKYRERLSNSARAEALEKFSIHKTVREMEDLLEGFIHGNRG